MYCIFIHYNIPSNGYGAEKHSNMVIMKLIETLFKTLNFRNHVSCIVRGMFNY